MNSGPEELVISGLAIRIFVTDKQSVGLAKVQVGK